MSDDRDDEPTAGRVASSPHTELMERVAMNVSDEMQAAIRKDERFRIAQLLNEGCKTLAGFAAGPEQLVQAIAFMLQLEGE